MNAENIFPSRFFIFSGLDADEFASLVATAFNATSVNYKLSVFDLLCLFRLTPPVSQTLNSSSTFKTKATTGKASPLITSTTLPFDELMVGLALLAYDDVLHPEAKIVFAFESLDLDHDRLLVRKIK